VEDLSVVVDPVDHPDAVVHQTSSSQRIEQEHHPCHHLQSLERKDFVVLTAANLEGQERQVGGSLVVELLFLLE